MRLVICDSNRILGEALAAALAADDRGVTALATSTADACLAAVASYRPHVCMLDLRLPGVHDGLALVHEIRDRFPGTFILVLSDVADHDIRARAKKLGITGFLSKNRTVGQIADVLHSVASGRPAFDPDPWTAAPDPGTLFVLTPREKEVLRRIAAGQHTQQMAREMEIADSTLRTYVKHLFAKLGVHSRIEAAAVASRTNIL
jgi:two-component system, NarL family, nitrate/nitrite response regulator NarL